LTKRMASRKRDIDKKREKIERREGGRERGV
jgi:hypothetical protein